MLKQRGLEVGDATNIAVAVLTGLMVVATAQMARRAQDQIDLQRQTLEDATTPWVTLRQKPRLTPNEDGDAAVFDAILGIADPSVPVFHVNVRVRIDGRWFGTGVRQLGGGAEDEASVSFNTSAINFNAPTDTIQLTFQDSRGQRNYQEISGNALRDGWESIIPTLHQFGKDRYPGLALKAARILYGGSTTQHLIGRQQATGHRCHGFPDQGQRPRVERNRR